jgi:hypothetical protein
MGRYIELADEFDRYAARGQRWGRVDTAKLAKDFFYAANDAERRSALMSIALQLPVPYYDSDLPPPPMSNTNKVRYLRHWLDQRIGDYIELAHKRITAYRVDTDRLAKDFLYQVDDSQVAAPSDESYGWENYPSVRH